MSEWTPEIGCNLYLLQPNRQLNKLIGDLYGTFNGVVDKKYHMTRFDGKKYVYNEDTFFKFYSGEPVKEGKKKACSVNTDVEKAAKIKRKP